MRRLLTIGALVALLLPATATAGGAEEEASRQLDYARAELADGRAERAVTSAESALRLDPSLYPALVVKGLAYEQLGDHALAEVLFSAYLELAPGGSARPEAEAALARLAAAEEGSAKPRGPRRPAVEVVETGLQTGLDPAPYRARVEAAQEAGHCLSARAAATELTQAAPEAADGWRLSGDAARCAGEHREAALAYRRYLELGGDAPGVGPMIAALERELGVVEVAVIPVTTGDAMPRLELRWGREVQEPEARPGNVAAFRHLPVGLPLVLTSSGRGLQVEEIDVPPLAAGETRALNFVPTYVGVGRLEVALVEGITVTGWGSEGEFEAVGGSQVVTAGAVALEVSGEHGTLRYELDVTRDETVRFETAPRLPAKLTLSALPAGAQVSLEIEGLAGDDRATELHVPGGVGSLDPVTGVLLADPVRLEGVLGGRGLLTVTHPTLGELRESLIIEPGAVNARTVGWPAMPGVGAVQTRWEVWQQERAIVARERALRPLPTAIVAVGSGVVAGILGTTAALAAADEAGAETAYQDLVDNGAGQASIDAAWAELGDARTRTDRFGAATAVTAGIAGLGLGITITLGATGPKVLPDPAWEP